MAYRVVLLGRDENRATYANAKRILQDGDSNKIKKQTDKRGRL